MEFVLNNIDLIRLIYSFGDVSHRENTKKITKEVLFYTKEKWTPIIEDIDRKEVKYWRDQTIYNTFQDYCSSSFTKKKCMEIIKICSRCKCCDKHNVKKPYIIDNIAKYNSEIESHEIYTIFECNCECYCRHLSRNAYRGLIKNNVI